VDVPPSPTGEPDMASRHTKQISMILCAEWNNLNAVEREYWIEVGFSYRIAFEHLFPNYKLTRSPNGKGKKNKGKGQERWGKGRATGRTETPRPDRVVRSRVSDAPSVVALG